VTTASSRAPGGEAAALAACGPGEGQVAQFAPVFTAGAIACRVAELGAAISRKYQGQRLLIVGVLKGAFVFLADLIRHVTVSARVDFVRLASYGANDSPGEIVFCQDMEMSCTGEHILIVEDIVDTGRTMAQLLSVLRLRGAASVALCALIDKTERREAQVTVDFPGFVLAKGFLVGYGLDFAEDYRSLPGIYEMKPARRVMHT